MPNLPISQLPSLTNPQLSSVIPISEGSTTYKTTLGTIANYVSQSVANTGSFVTTSSFNSFTASYNAATGSFIGYYGSFYHTASLLNTVPGTPNTMSLSSTDISFGVVVSGSINDKIKFNVAGVYNVQFSAQLDKSSAGADFITYVWIRKNNVDVPISNTGVTVLGGSNAQSFAAWNWFVNANAGDYVQIMWASSEAAARVHYEPSPPYGPAVPSLIVTANRVS